MVEERRKEKFLELMELNSAVIHSICRIYTSDGETYRDLYQEILMQSWRSFPNFEGRSKFSTWLYRVALNTALTEFHRSQRNREQMRELEDRHHRSDQEIDQEGKIEILYKAIDKLNALEKAIILLYLEEASYKEMAEIFGISVSNVGVRLKRAKNRLERILMKFE